MARMEGGLFRIGVHSCLFVVKQTESKGENHEGTRISESGQGLPAGRGEEAEDGALFVFSAFLRGNTAKNGEVGKPRRGFPSGDFHWPQRNAESAEKRLRLVLPMPGGFPLCVLCVPSRLFQILAGRWSVNSLAAK